MRGDRARTSLPAVERAGAAVEEAVAVEGAGAAVEAADDLRAGSLQRLAGPGLRLRETGKRPCSSGEGAKQNDESRLFHVTSFVHLEADVLECLRRLAVELGRGSVLAALGREVAASHPGSRPVADGLELFGACIGRAEKLLRLIQAPLLHQRTTQHELSRRDVVQEVVAVLHQGKR